MRIPDSISSREQVPGAQLCEAGAETQNNRIMVAFIIRMQLC